MEMADNFMLAESRCKHTLPFCVFFFFFFFLLLFMSVEIVGTKLDEHCYRGQTRMQNGWMIDPKS